MNFKVYSRARSFVFLKLIVSIVLVFICSGCGGIQHGTEVYKTYNGPDKTPKEVVTILMVSKADIGDYVDWVIIDDKRIKHKKYGSIIITPGSYSIKWERKFKISPMIKASGSEVRSWTTSINLEAGHTYTIHAKRTIGQGYILYSWITDDTQNKLIWGTEYVPGPYDYLRNSLRK